MKGINGEDIIIKGTINNSSKGLDLKGEIILSKRDSEDFTDVTGIVKYLLNKHGRICIPIIIKGDINKPAVSIDKSILL